AGFLSFDPLIGWRNKGRLVVLEGNRRLAAIQLLLDPERAPARYSTSWRALSDQLSDSIRKDLLQIPVVVCPNREAADVLAYIGYRPVSGVLEWPPVEKAAFIAHLIEVGKWSYKRIAQQLGSKPAYVERHFVAYRLVRQAEELDVPGAQNLRGTFG